MGYRVHTSLLTPRHHRDLRPQIPHSGGFGGVSRLKRIYEDLCVYGSSMGEGWGEGGFSEPTC
jgi:hypothetical protein